jgi:hypothetical protein
MHLYMNACCIEWASRTLKGHARRLLRGVLAVVPVAAVDGSTKGVAEVSIAHRGWARVGECQGGTESQKHSDDRQGLHCDSC